MPKLHVLGTGGYHPNDLRHTACLMLPEAGIILDAGTSFFRTRELITTTTLDIFLTHAHLDHCQGLTYLLDVLLDKHVGRVTVHGLGDHLEAVGGDLFRTRLFPVPFGHELKPIATETQVDAWTVRWLIQPEHPGMSLGYRLDSPEVSFAYLTDTIADPRDEEKAAFIRGVDLLIHECYFANAFTELAARTGHSCAGAVGQFATKAEVGRLALTHANPILTPEELRTIENEVNAEFPESRFLEDQEVLSL
ncbi:ribonuclease Z [Planctomycetes bacterium Pan216]|uniref:Ribonuclease Z n=1 Tax=Kolteria novifilia TaxID=2527975 RepID=A0A518B6N2_9BACT|nr:ribonuclease Z [Planctomycetes bacterium Pan216]